MYLKELINVFYVITYLYNFIDISEASYCNVPNHCVDILECRYIVDMVNGTCTPEERNVLRKSKCGNRKRHFCCPIDLPEPTKCGVYYSDWDKVYGGVDTNIEEYPWTVLLKKKGDDFKNHLCAGSLINKLYILTAAHCCKKINSKTNEIEDIEVESVLLGEWNKTSDIDCVKVNSTCEDSKCEYVCADRPIEIKVKEIIVYENFIPTSSFQGDIALLRLEKEVEYTKFIQPICLPLNDNLKNDLFDESTTFTVVGWGKTATTSFTSDIKQKARLPTFNRYNCIDLYWNKFRSDIVDTHICAGGEHNINSCRGDSGGPLLTLNYENKYDPRLFLAGIVSFGPQNCAKDGVPNIYTRVGAYIDWILKNIKP